MAGETDKTLTINILLAEFGALRKEISDRSSAQHGLMTLNLTAITALGGFALSNVQYRLLLLLIPLLSPAIGMLYLDHGFNIAQIGAYLGRELQRACQAVTSGVTPCGYESVVRGYEGRLVRRLVFAVPTLLMFAGAPAVALALVYPAATGWASVLWIAGLALLLAYLLFWWVFVAAPLRTASTTDAAAR